MLNDNTVTECGLANIVMFPSSKRYDSTVVLPDDANPLERYREALRVLKHRVDSKDIEPENARVLLNVLKQSYRFHRVTTR